MSVRYSKGSKLLAESDGLPADLAVQLWSYPVRSDGQDRVSYEIFVGKQRVLRFLWIDHREQAFPLALAWCRGFCYGRGKFVWMKFRKKRSGQ